jgi:hypothetical protein
MTDLPIHQRQGLVLDRVRIAQADEKHRPDNLGPIHYIILCHYSLHRLK